MTCVGHLNKPSHFSVPYVHHVPGATMNIFSISHLTDLNYTVTFIASSCIVQDPRIGEIVGTGRSHNHLYYMYILTLPNPTASVTCLLNSKFTTCYLCHYRLGHPSLPRLRELPNTSSLGSFPMDTLSPVLVANGQNT